MDSRISDQDVGWDYFRDTHSIMHVQVCNMLLNANFGKKYIWH